MPAIENMEVDALDISGDGGVLKRILVEGTGTETPPEGSSVFVHYVGTLQSDGSEFDSSRKRNDPFSFKLGTGSVIKGWDKGVATMKKGEKAVLTCRSDYAYGQSGSPPSIPGGATLDFEVELLRWVDGDDVSGDGEVVKKVIEKGTGFKSPKQGEKATIKYKGTLADGTVLVDHFDSPCEFVVGEDSTIPEAVQLAVKKMHVREKARVQSSAKYAGNNQDATFEIELIGWQEVVSVGTEGGISKVIIQQGEGYQTPNAGATVTLMIGEGEKLEMVERNFILGEGQLPDAVEQAVLGMKKGERAQLLVQPSAQDADMETVTDGVKIWELQLVDFEKAKESWSMKPEEKLENCERLKGQGTDFFKQGKVRVGLRLYRRAAQLVESDTDMSDDQKTKRRELFITNHLNLALCHLKLKHFKEAISECEKVLQLESENFKALSRRGCAYSGLNEWDQAKVDLTRALEIDPNDKAVKKELSSVALKIKKQEEKEKAVFAKMFA